jgi:hypothetical protein
MLTETPDSLPRVSGLSIEDTGTREVLERGKVLRLACLTGCIAAIDTALHLGESISAVPVASVQARYKPAALIVGGGSSSNEAKGKGPTDTGDAVIVKASTLHLAAKGRQVDTFSHLVSLGARLDEPGTSIASMRSLIRLVTQGPNATALLRLFLGNGAHLALQLSQEMRDEALFALLQACASSRSSLALSLEECVDFARTLLDAGSSPDLFRGFQSRSTSTLSTAVHTLSPELVCLLLDHGACPDGPPDLQRTPLSYWPLHIPLCAVAHALATSLLDPSAQAAQRQIADMLLHRGANINVCVPCIETNYDWYVSCTSPLLVFLDAVPCWDDDGGGPQALDTLRFLLDRGACPEGPPAYPAPESGLSHITPSVLLRSGRYSLGPARLDPIRNLLDDWGVGRLASPAFASALELLVGHPRGRGGVRDVADALAKYEYCTISPPSPSTSSPPDTEITTQTDDAVLAAWRCIMSSTAALLAPHELGEFLHAYIVRKGTCPRQPRRWRGGPHHRSAEDEIGDLAMTTVSVLLAAGADMNHRYHSLSPSGRIEEIQRGDGGRGTYDEATALHGICLWLAGRASEEYSEIEGWRPSCRGLRHTRRRTRFIRYLVEECGADRGAKYLGWTPAEMLVRLRRPELDAEEMTKDWSSDADVVREARQALVALLEDGSKTTSCS